MGSTHYADVRGYRLEVPAAWDHITDLQVDQLQNGIGPDAWPPARRRLLDEATGLRPAADVHDVDYCLGRSRSDRKTADWRFLRNCLRVILQDSKGWLGLLIRGNWRATATRALVAWLLFRALRLGGRRAFDAATKVDIAIRGRSASPMLSEE